MPNSEIMTVTSETASTSEAAGWLVQHWRWTRPRRYATKSEHRRNCPAMSSLLLAATLLQGRWSRWRNQRGFHIRKTQPQWQVPLHPQKSPFATMLKSCRTHRWPWTTVPLFAPAGSLQPVLFLPQQWKHLKYHLTTWGIVGTYVYETFGCYWCWRSKIGHTFRIYLKSKLWKYVNNKSWDLFFIFFNEKKIEKIFDI